MTRKSDEATHLIRLAPVMTGGSSLAIWMAGVSTEFYRLLRSRRESNMAYSRVLETVGADIEIDVLAGTSAGGLNAVLLAFAQLHDVASDDFEYVSRDAWMNLGDFTELLQDAANPDVQSLLRGEEYFYGKVEDFLGELAGFRPTPAEESEATRGLPRIDLSVPATRVEPTVDTYRDELGLAIEEVNFRHVFRYGWGDEATNPPGPLPNGSSSDWLIETLARVARTSASFPVAFEPSFVTKSIYEGESTRPSGEEPELGYFLVDGGILDNKPLEQAIDIIEQRRAKELVRRVIPFVVPEAGAPQHPALVKQDDQPPLAEIAGKVATEIPSTETISAELRRITERNERVASQRRRRHSLARSLDPSGGGTAAADAQKKLGQMAAELAEPEALMHAEASSRTIVRKFRKAATQRHGDSQWIEQAMSLLLGEASRARLQILLDRGLPRNPPESDIGHRRLRFGRDWQGLDQSALPLDASAKHIFDECGPWRDEELAWRDASGRWRDAKAARAAANAPWPWGVWSVRYITEVMTEPLVTALQLIDSAAPREVAERTVLLELKSVLSQVRSSVLSLRRLTNDFWAARCDALALQLRVAEALAETDSGSAPSLQEVVDLAKSTSDENGYDVELTAVGARAVQDAVASAATGHQQALIQAFVAGAYREWPDSRSDWFEMKETAQAQRIRDRTSTNWQGFIGSADSDADLSISNALRMLECLAYQCAIAYTDARGSIASILEARLAEFDDPDVLPLGDRGDVQDALNVHHLIVGPQPVVTLRNLINLSVVQGFGQIFVVEYPIELVHVSADAAYAPFKRDNRSVAQDKLAGKQLFNFAAFLKSSWRANDWMWGRLDAAYYLANILVDPTTIKARFGHARTLPEAAALDVLRSFAPTEDLAASGLDQESVAKQRRAALEELTVLFSPELNHRGEVKALPETAMYVAMVIQQEILVAELPRVADAVDQSKAELGNESKAARRFKTAVEDSSSDGSLAKKSRQLLGLCEIGKETIADELGSDRLTRLGGRTSMVASNIVRNPKAKIPGGEWLFGTGRLGTPATAFYWLTRLATSRSRTVSTALVAILIAAAAVLAFFIGSISSEAGDATWDPPASLVALAAAVLFGWILVLLAYRLSAPLMLALVVLAAVVGLVWIGPRPIGAFAHGFRSYNATWLGLFGLMLFAVSLAWVIVRLSFAGPDIERLERAGQKGAAWKLRAKQLSSPLGLLFLGVALLVLGGAFADDVERNLYCGDPCAPLGTVAWRTLDALHTSSVGVTLVALMLAVLFTVLWRFRKYH